MYVRVFVIEDSPLICERIAEEIAGLDDVEMVGAADCEADAIPGVAGTAPDVALVDVNLRQGNGLNVIREVRKKLPKSRLRIVIMTNHASPVLRRQSLALGADDFVDKSSEFERIPEILLAVRDSGPHAGHAH